MADLSVAHRAALAQVIERVPDATLAKLALAVLSMPGDKAKALSQMLGEETLDRKRRARVLAPLIPMFRSRADGVGSTCFPPAVLPRLWKAASAREPHLLPILDDDPLRGEPADPVAALAVAGRICMAGAAATRDRPDVIWPPDAVVGPARETALFELAGCCDLAPLAARGLSSLDHWTGRPDEDRLAELRLLIRDASAVAPDGAQRLLEIWFAHLDDASTILRLVVQASSAAGRELFLFESELAVFVTRLIKAVDDRVARIGVYRTGGADPFATLRADIAWCAAVLTELDMTIQMQPGGVWGKQARDARMRINATLSRLLAGVEKTVEGALPTARVPGSGRVARTLPRLDQPVPVATIEAATAALALVRAVRSSAGVFGCEGQRWQVLQTLTDRLTTYAEQALDLVNRGEASDETTALKIVATVADFLTVLEAEQEARTVRRRVAVAGAPAMVPVAS